MESLIGVEPISTSSGNLRVIRYATGTEMAGATGVEPAYDKIRNLVPIQFDYAPELGWGSKSRTSHLCFQRATL